MNIYEALKLEGENIRVSCGDRWLVWDDGTWWVFSRKYGARTSETLYQGNVSEKAIQFLVYGSES